MFALQTMRAGSVAWSGTYGQKILDRIGAHQTEMVGNDRIDFVLVKYNSFEVVPVVPRSGQQPQRLSSSSRLG